MNIVIIGGVHHNTLGVIRAMGERGVHPSLINLLIVDANISKRNFLSASKYILKDNIFYLRSDEYVVEFLLSFKNSIDFKPIVICCSDGSAFKVMSNKDILSPYYHISSIKMDVVDFMDKSKQTDIAGEFGFNVPKSMVLSNREISSWSTYPCITKPITSIAGAGKADIKISYNREELQKHLNETKAESVQVQEYLVKDTEFQLIGCSLNLGEIVIIPGYTNILRQPMNTNTGYLRYSPIDDLDIDLVQIKGYLKHIGYSGLFSIEFIRTEDDKSYYMEINLRNDGNAYCVTSAGVNLPYIWAYYNFYGEMPINEQLSITKSIFWIPDFFDLFLGIDEVGFFGWIKQMIQADSHSLYNKEDISPFLMVLFEYGNKLVKKVVRILNFFQR